MSPQDTTPIEVRKKVLKYCICQDGCLQLGINSTCSSCEQISIPMYTFPRRLLDLNRSSSPTDLTFRDFWALVYHGSHAKVLIQEDGSAGFTACSYGLCFNFDVENLVVISFLFQLGAESRQRRDREGLFVQYVRAMLKALGRDRKQLLPTGPAPRTELQKVDDTILQRVPLVDNWIKENHAKLHRACWSVDLSIIQGVMEKCSGQCCACHEAADLRSPCCLQFICSPCFEHWHQNDHRCYVCHEDFCQWLEGPLDWNLVQLIVRKNHIDT